MSELAKLIEDVREIRDDCEQVARDDSISSGERRAWLAIARKCNSAIDRVATSAALSAPSDAKLTREQIEAMRQRLLESHELHPLTHRNIRALCDMALAALSGVRVPVEPTHWNKADHHASCRPSDSNLVWQCGQCGHVAAAKGER